MLTFNQLLRAAGLDPATVRLVRHRDTKPKVHAALYRAALSLDPRFEQYQERQGTPQVIDQFRAGKHLAGFVAEPTTGHTIFAGVWVRLGERAPEEHRDNPFQPDPPGVNATEFLTRRLSEFDPYC